MEALLNDGCSLAMLEHKLTTWWSTDVYCLAALRQHLTGLHHENAPLAPPGRLLTGLRHESAPLAPPGRLLTGLCHESAPLGPPGRLLTGLHHESAPVVPPARLLISRQHLLDFCSFLQQSNSVLQTQLQCVSQECWELSESLDDRGHQLLDANKALTAVKAK